MKKMSLVNFLLGECPNYGQVMTYQEFISQEDFFSLFHRMEENQMKKLAKAVDLDEYYFIKTSRNFEVYFVGLLDYLYQKFKILLTSQNVLKRKYSELSALEIIISRCLENHQKTDYNNIIKNFYLELYYLCKMKS